MAKSIKLATKPMKQAAITPSMLAFLYPLNEEVPGYSRVQFEEDLCNECEKDIRGAFEADAARVSLDFTEGRLATRADPRNPWTSVGGVESEQEISDALVRAANFIPKERLGSTDDCGFSPFSIDEKPSDGSPDYAREVAFQKIRNRMEGTRMAAEKLGVG